LVREPSPGQLSGDAGLLPIRQFDERPGLTRAFAQALNDSRDPDLTEHSLLEMVRSRVYGILAGYEDQNDHDTPPTTPSSPTPPSSWSPTAPRRTTTWPASPPSRASRTPSPSRPSSGCATCSSTSSSPPSTHRRAT